MTPLEMGPNVTAGVCRTEIGESASGTMHSIVKKDSGPSARAAAVPSG